MAHLNYSFHFLTPFSIQACKKSDTPVYLVCAEHMQGDCFEPEVPFWFTANVSINQGPPVKVTFANSQSCWFFFSLLFIFFFSLL